MALTMIEASKLSRDPLASGVFAAFATSDELIGQIGWNTIAGKAEVYDREKALPSVAFVDVGDTISESSATFDQVTVPLRRIVSDVDVNSFLEDQLSTDGNDQRAIQLEKKLKAMGRTIGQKIVTGTYATGSTVTVAIAGITITTIGPNQDSDRFGPGSINYNNTGTLAKYRAPGDITFGPAVNIGSNGTYTLLSDNPNKWIIITVVAASLPAAIAESGFYITSSSKEWDGLLKLIPTTHAQAILSTGASGDALSFGKLDQALNEKVKVKDNLFWIGNAKMKNALLGLLRGLGGTTPDQIMLPGMNRPVPTYAGVPFLQTDWIPSTESKGAASTLTSLFLASLSDDGLSMLAGQGASTTLDTSPLRASVMGTRIEDVGVVQDKDATRTRVKFTGALKLGSELSLCRIAELTTV